MSPRQQGITIVQQQKYLELYLVGDFRMVGEEAGRVWVRVGVGGINPSVMS